MVGDYREIADTVFDGITKVGGWSSARFWATWGLVFVSLAVASIYFLYPVFYPPVSASIFRAEAARDQKFEALKHDVQELTSALARTTSALNVMTRERQKDTEAFEAQLKDSQQKVAKLEAQAQDFALLKPRLALIERDSKRLTSDFVKSLLAAGATPSTPSYAPTPNRPKLPPEIEKLSPDLGDEGKQPHCLLMLKGYALFCDIKQSGSQQ